MLAIIVTSAFVFGFLAARLGLPPLVGFLVCGFVLRGLGAEGTSTLENLGNFGVSLLLFTIGLKLKLKDLARPIVWGGGTLHLVATSFALGLGIWLLGQFGVPIASGIGFDLAVLAGFALSFSSTVFAVKSLEERAELAALHGVIAVGILIMQDIIAVGFLAVADGKIPSPWAFLLLLLIPASPALTWILKRCGRGELLILLGFVLTYAAYETFSYYGVKGDLGAIAVGMLIGRHPMAKDLAQTLLGFKDVFLMAFFVGIGLSEALSLDAVVLGGVLLLLLPIKVGLYYVVLTRFHLKPRTAFLTSTVLANYSEFGLVVMALAVNNAWLEGSWLVVIAIALSFSYIMAAPLNTHTQWLFERFQGTLAWFNTSRELPEQAVISFDGVHAVIFGMGRVGAGSYRVFEERYGPDRVLGVDSNPERVRLLKEAGLNVIEGDAADTDFWDRVDAADGVRIVLLAMANHNANVHVAQRVHEDDHPVFMAATANHPEEEEELRRLGIQHVYNFYSGAGAGFAEQAWKEFDRVRFVRRAQADAEASR